MGVGLISPVLLRAFRGSSSCGASCSCWLFHPSWHMCIYKRMFESENKTLTREGVAQFLELYETKRLPNSPGFSEFIIGPLMDALSESSLYGRLGKASTKRSGLKEPAPKGPVHQLSASVTVALNAASVPQEFRHTKDFSITDEPESLLLVGTENLLVLRSRSLAYCHLDHKTLYCFLHVLLHWMRWRRMKVTSSQSPLFLFMVLQYILSETCFLKVIGKIGLIIEGGGTNPACHRHFCTTGPSNDHTGTPGCPSTTIFQLTGVQLTQPLSLATGPMPGAARCRHHLPSQALSQAAAVLHRAVTWSSHHEKWLVPPLLLPAQAWLPGAGAAEDRAPLPRTPAGQAEIWLCDWLYTHDRCFRKSINCHVEHQERSSLSAYVRTLVEDYLKAPASKNVVLSFLSNSVMTAAESILEFVLRRLTTSELNTVSDLDRCNLYLALLSDLVNLCSKAGWKKGPSIWNFISSLINASIRNLQETGNEQEPKLGEQIQKVVSMASLTVVCEIIDRKPELQLKSLHAVETLKGFISSVQLNQVLKKPSYIEEKNRVRSKDSAAEKELEGLGHVHARRSTTRCLLHMRDPCGHCYRKSPIDGAGTHRHLKWTHRDAYLEERQLLHKIILKLVEMSTARTGVFNIVLSYCCQSWLFPTSDDTGALENPFSNAGNYSELITEACVFGTVFRRDQSTNRDDHYVRVCAVKFLCLLDGSNTLHKMFMEDLVIKLLDKDELVSKSRTRYYVNSLQHRIKNRLWQTLLVIFPKLDQGEEKLKTSICTFLSVLSHFDIILENTSEKKPILKKALLVVLQWCFNHNFSVRLYALVALKKIWGMCKALCVEEFEALTPVIESSLHQVENMHGTGYTDISLPAAFHWLHSRTELLNLKPSDWSQQDMGSDLVETDNQPEWTDVQKKIIPWKNSSPDLDLELVFQDRAAKLGKSNSRLIVVASLIDKPTNLGGHAQYHTNGASQVAPANELVGPGKKALVPWEHEKPRRSDLGKAPSVPMSTSVPPVVHWAPTDLAIRSASPIPLVQASWHRQPPLVPMPSALPDFQCATDLLVSEAPDLPLLITGDPVPSSSRALDLPLTSYHAPPFSLLQSESEQEDVVSRHSSHPLYGAPFHYGHQAYRPPDPQPSWFGLCRTSEIFGASALVVGSLHYINDKQFQHLSVSAEQWLPLVEVKPSQLVNYLQQKKTEGYTIIGVEQTAKSSDLTEYCFPEKSLLLLGNEHEGIPANLIQHLDVCVEIPQQGIIRSLNVHHLPADTNTASFDRREETFEIMSIAPNHGPMKVPSVEIQD
ncbi:Putative methyltransferase TARBP1 [Chelonia mydas]|uniref:Putative methyltransferase TARBP1 n=1 Tax=Chelonia mydas TaxID=8469 RepID=M7APS1_CHEMY|nr:Putative methyltransferase TARBP1 [Chelonia mydas]